MTKALRILIADDHEVVRHGLRALLKDHEGWEVCGEACDGCEAVQKARELRPDIVMLDVGMPNLNGLDAARQILRHEPEMMVLILTVDDSEQVIHEAIEMGAHGFLLKSDAGRDLVTGLEALRGHRTYFTSKVAGPLMSDGSKDGSPATSALPRHQLTPRERQVVQLLAEGKTTKEAAAILGMRVKTAETHRANIMRKLHFHSVSELVLYAIRNHLVDIPLTRTG